MEIISYVVEGAMEHQDSLGNGSVIRAGEVQRMSAGSGIRHSEFNHHEDQPLRFLQIWIEPNADGAAPGYEQRPAHLDEAPGQLRLLISPDGRDNSLVIRQDARLYGARLEPDQGLALELAAGRYGWVQVIRGRVQLGAEHELGEGDGAALIEERSLELVAGDEESEILFFDLA